MEINLDELVNTTYILKTFFLTIYTYYTFLKIINKKDLDKKSYIKAYVYLFVVAVIACILKKETNFFMTMICLLFSISLICAETTKNNLGYSILITVISLSFNYILSYIVIMIGYIINKTYVIRNDYINLILMMIIQVVILNSVFKIRRFKNGISFFKEKSHDDYFDMIILNICASILFSVIVFANIDVFAAIDIIISKIFFISFIIFAIIMIITIQKSLQLYYKHKLLVNELEETKSELDSKNKEIEKLEQENLAFSKKSHSIAHKQKSLEFKLNQLLQNSEVASELDITDRVNNLSTELYSENKQMELSKTGIIQIDDMLKYMQSECIKENIEFDLQIVGNIYYMVNNLITADELEILIADHIKDAIIAIQHSDNINRSILVRMGKIDNCYSLYIYDSGIEFEKETLTKLGKEPCSTHLDEGGTGMGFMNTFDTLRKHNASMIINELNSPCKENFTKAIIFKFDNKNEFKIISYREEKK